MNLPDTLKGIKEGSVILTCPKHAYVAARKCSSGAVVAIPPDSHGCADCWRVYYISDYILTPENTRAQRLDELEEVIQHAAEFEREGKFGKDFELYDTKDSRFEVNYERDAYPDKEEK